MACGALIRRNKFISDHLNAFRARYLCHAHSTQLRAFTSFTHHHKNDNPTVMVNWGLLSLRLEFTRTATASQFIRSASTNTQPNHDAKKMMTKGQVDSDQTFQGSSSTKANRLRESYNVASKFLHRVWSTISSLIAMASMDRYERIMEYEIWKYEVYTICGGHRIELLFLSVKITLRLLVKICRGKSLSKRERQILTQSTADIFSLVPVSVNIFVPFIEFMLPVFLKLFPSMLPPTSQDNMQEQETLKKKVRGLKARSEFAVFLQDTARAMTKLNVKKTFMDYVCFVNKCRRHEHVSDEDIWCFARFFNDELTLDNISICQLVNMCNCMGIPPCGTDEYLRFMLRKRLKLIKKEDKLINTKGVESLSEADLRKCCRERGIHSVEEMRQQLHDWLDLSLNHYVPSSLLILSRTFIMTGKSKPEEAIAATIASFSYDLSSIAGARSLPTPDSDSVLEEMNGRIESLEVQELLIMEEESRERLISKMKQPYATKDDLDLNEVAIPVAYAAEQARASVGDKQEKLCEISHANAAFATAIPVITECEKFLMLVKKEINLINSVHDKEGEYDKLIAMKADRAAREENEQDAELYIDNEILSVLANRADAVLQNLEKEIDDVDAKIGYRWRGLDRYCDGTVSSEVVAAAALCLKDAMGKEEKLMSNMLKYNGVDLVAGGTISCETLITCTCVGIMPYLESGCGIRRSGRCPYIYDTSKN